MLNQSQRIHVGPREHGLAFAVSQDTDNTGLSNPFDDFVTEFFEFRRGERGRFGFLKTQLGMRMKLLVNCWSGLNYLTHNPLVSESSKPRAGYSSPKTQSPSLSLVLSLATDNLFLEFGKVSYRN